MTSTPRNAVAATGGSSGSGFGQFLMQILSDRESYFTEVIESDRLSAKLLYALGTLLALSALYGASAGAYAGAEQALSLSAILLAAVVPITAFFLFTGADYYFLTLLHILIVLGSGLVGMAVLHEGLSFACEKRGVYPKKAMTIMKVWAVLFAFVGIQMAWNLQPFVGDRGQPFRLFRHNEGNFYTAILYSLERLSRGGSGAISAAPPATIWREGRRTIYAIPEAKPDSGRVNW